MIRKRIAGLLAALTVLMTLSACGGRTAEQTFGVLQDTKYDHVFLKISIDDFIAAGFNYGDSCDVAFSNGMTLEDIPFYSGYYVRSGEPLVVGYPGYEYIAVTRNNLGLWTEAGLTEGDSAVVTLREAGKYLNQQEALSQSYSNDRADYEDDIQFANFRELSGGELRESFLYRGASPVDNQKNRAATVNSLVEAEGIRFILDLADSEEEFLSHREREDFESFYAAGLYDAGSVALLSMSSAYSTDAFRQKLASGLKMMLTAEGPVYIHCLEGKDRTGFVCFLLESLAGASYDEMLRDYMKTYDNYYGITRESDPDKYDAIAFLYFDAFAACLHGTEDKDELVSADYTQDAEAYLLGAGMTADEITALRRMITKPQA
ncbi:MAG: tyrosine-protein phosphatase [Oscillospiraceae bacterium]|nr:tyrosine-protein phosphatase [Oscillospiraceae bacterium]